MSTKLNEKFFSAVTIAVLLSQVILSSIIILRLNSLSQALDQAVTRISVAPPQPEPESLQDVSVDDDPALGPNDAPITIIEFADFECGACRQADKALKQVIDKYSDKVRLVYRDFPLVPGSSSSLAAQAAQCAFEERKFWEMHDAIFASTDKITTDVLVSFASTLSLDLDRFRDCLESAKYSAEINNDIADGRRYGVTAVPTFFVNGWKFKGSMTFDQWQSIIDGLLTTRK